MDTTKKIRQRLSFESLGLSEPTQRMLQKVQYLKPTPVQAGMIPLVLKGMDVVGQARTGTGKTAAFAVPLIDVYRDAPPSKLPRVLVLVPTRELAVQVQQECAKLAADSPLRVAAIYGGRGIRAQMNQLAAGVDLVVGTPGRVIDHLMRRSLSLDQIECVVLDEADRMLDIGFRPAIERILRRCPTERQTLLLSATLPGPIIELARRYMDRPVRVNFSEDGLSAEAIEQFYFLVHEDKKLELLLRLLNREQPQQCIVFCRTKIGTERLYRRLLRAGLTSIRSIHGDLTQSTRDSVMKGFRDGSLQVLVATDVVGRGIDVTDISHIINYDVPELCDDYVHRVGRTGRMGRAGVAYTLVTPVQRDSLAEIEQRINRPLQREHLEGLSISAEEEARVKSQRTGRRRRIRRAL